MSFFTFSYFPLYWKVYFSPWAMSSVKSSSTDYNESNKPNKPNLKSLAHIGSGKSLVELGVPKNETFFFSHFSLCWKFYFFALSHGFLKRLTSIYILFIFIQPSNILVLVHLLDIGLLVKYKGLSLISLGDKPLLGDGYARVFPSPYVHATCMARQAIEVLVAYKRGWPNHSALE